MARYENVEHISAKYWEIVLEGTTITMRQGRMDSDHKDEPPSITTKKCKTEEEAKWKYDELVANRIDKGYQLVLSAEEEEAEEEGKDLAPKAENPQLEEAIHANPRSPDAYLVYGDWLQSQGDPRGELIAIQAALANAPSDDELTRKSKELIARYDKRFLGATLAPLSVEDMSAYWRFGFIQELYIGGTYSGTTCRGAWKELLDTGSAKFLESLELNELETEYGTPMFGSFIGELAEHGVPKTLRRLVFDPKDYQLSWVDLGDLSIAYPRLGALEELTIRAGKMALGKAMNLPSLKKLEIVSTSLTKDNVEAIAAGDLANLTDLTLHIGPRGDATIESVLPLLDKKRFPKLRHLGLRNAMFENEIVRAVLDSSLLPQLKSLDFSDGTLDDTGGEALLQSASTLRHLTMIEISYGYLSRPMCARLREALKGIIHISDQRSVVREDGEEGEDDYDDVDEERYVNLAE